MKLAISIVTAISLGLNCTAPADNYDTIAAKGYRWVAIHAPYASTTEQGAERITNHRTGSTESQIVEDERAFYLVPGKIVQIIKEDAVTGRTNSKLYASAFP
jgi:hypothetical protein